MLFWIFIHISILNEVVSAGDVPDLSDYNPLKDEGFIVKGGWRHYTTPHTPVVGSAADLTRGITCQRVITFSGLGVVLDYHRTACNDLDPRVGLLEAFDAIWYYNDVLAMQDTEGIFKVVFRKRNMYCVMETFKINNVRSSLKVGVEIVYASHDNDCGLLARSAEPTIRLISSSPRLGGFSPKIDWTMFNIWEPLGAMTHLYKEEGEMHWFRLLVVTSYGRVVDMLKVTAGDIQGLVVTDKALRYGDVLVVKAQGENMDTFKITLNPNNGQCIRRTITLHNDEGRVTRTKSDAEHLQESDPECRDLIQEQRSKKPTDEGNRWTLGDLVQSLNWDEFNLNQEMGAKMEIFRLKGDFSSKVVVLAKTVPLAEIRLDNPPTRVVAREGVLYHDTDIVLKKGEDQNSFIVIKSGYSPPCSRETYVVKEEKERFEKEFKSKSSLSREDPECKELLEGSKLRNPEADKYGAAVDEKSFIAIVEEEIKADDENGNIIKGENEW